jgi:hypothetical protein
MSGHFPSILSYPIQSYHSHSLTNTKYHTYIHNIHTIIYTPISYYLTFINTSSIHTFILYNHTSVHTYFHTYNHTNNHTILQTFIHSYAYLQTKPFIYNCSDRHVSRFSYIAKRVIPSVSGPEMSSSNTV